MADESTKPPSAAPPPAGRTVDQGKRQFIVAARRGSQAFGAGIRPMSTAAVRTVVEQLPGLEMVRVLRPRRGVSALSLTADEATEVYVVRLDPERVEPLRQMTYPQLVLEEDALLEYGTQTGLMRPAPTCLASWNFTGGVETRQIRFRVVGDGDSPLAGVGVSLAGEGFPQEGRTDKRGELSLPLIRLPGKRARSLFVSAPSNCWDQYLTEPELSDHDINVVRLQTIEETVPGFPDHFRYGWGQIQMGLDRVPETLTCKGVRIAIVDSGADTTHPLLRHIRFGRDLTDKADPHAWTQDVVGHGSHCAGIIAARDESGKMLRGFAPEAEVHVLKVFPGGRFSSLLEALDYCIEFDIDIVNLSLGSPQPSQTIEQKMEEAALHGIACIVAAGNSGGPVQYPASSPYTMAVGAIGRLKEYPDKTWDATTVLPGMVAPDGIFAPNFTSVGPEVAVCAPGVAIVSTVPGGFEPQSGTSMAAPHVTGLAALLLAHHPAFQGPLRARTQQRVAALFTMIRSLCVPYAFGSLRTGAGMPRLHGLEQFLRPSPQPATSPGNGQAVATASSTHTPAGFGIPVGQSAPTAPHAPAFSAPVFGPQEGSAVMGNLVVDPLYLQAVLVAQAWPVQALLESMRRQYGGI
jgi:subtilisin